VSRKVPDESQRRLNGPKQGKRPAAGKVGGLQASIASKHFLGKAAPDAISLSLVPGPAGN